MKPFIKAILLFVLALVLTSFAVANRHDVRFVVDPFINRDVAAGLVAPLYLVIFISFLIGSAVGGSVVWFGQARWRNMARKAKKDADVWQRESEKLKRGFQTGSTGAGSSSSAAIRA